MLDKRVWPNVIYAVIIFVVCVTLWQFSADSDHFPVAVYSLYSSNSSLYSYPVNTLPADDYHQLVDLNNFTFTMLNLPCSNDSNVLLLILVHSNPSNFDLRKLVRATWGQNTLQVKVLFFVGLVNSTVKSKIERENEEFEDLIQGSFVDAYRNLTYKHVMVMKYVVYHCPQAKYILKTDDDVFVNMPLMMNFLTSDLSPFGGSRMLFCTLKKRSMVLRTWRSKWRVSFKEYPAKIYPPYCPGFAILYSPDVVFELYREAQKTAYFWIDDVFMTGILAAKLHLAHVNIDNVVLTKTAMGKALHKPPKINQLFLFGSPDVNEEEINALWEYVNNHDMRSSLLRDIT